MDRAPRFLCDWLLKNNTDVRGGDAAEAAEVREEDAFADELVGPAAPGSSSGVNRAPPLKVSSQVGVPSRRTDSWFGSPQRAGSFDATEDNFPGKAKEHEYIKKMPPLDIQEKKAWTAGLPAQLRA